MIAERLLDRLDVHGSSLRSPRASGPTKIPQERLAARDGLLNLTQERGIRQHPETHRRRTRMALRSKSGGWLVAVCLLVMPSVAGPTEKAQPVRRSLLPGRPGRAIRPVRAVEVRSSRAPRVV